VTPKPQVPCSNLLSSLLANLIPQYSQGTLVRAYSISPPTALSSTDTAFLPLVTLLWFGAWPRAAKTILARF
jgi:hypothetical protein